MSSQEVTRNLLLRLVEAQQSLWTISVQLFRIKHWRTLRISRNTSHLDRKSITMHSSKRSSRIKTHRRNSSTSQMMKSTRFPRSKTSKVISSNATLHSINRSLKRNFNNEFSERKSLAGLNDSMNSWTSNQMRLKNSTISHRELLTSTNRLKGS